MGMDMDLVLEISAGCLLAVVVVVLYFMLKQMDFKKWGKFWGYLNSLPERPSTLVYESLVWLPLGATMLKVALEADYDEKESHCDDINAWLHVISFYLLSLGTIGLGAGLIKQCSPRDTLIFVPRAVYVSRLVGLLFEIVWVVAGWTAYPIFDYRDNCNAVGTWSEIIIVLLTGFLAFIAGLICLLCFIITPFCAMSSTGGGGSYGSGV